MGSDATVGIFVGDNVVAISEGRLVEVDAVGTEDSMGETVGPEEGNTVVEVGRGIIVDGEEVSTIEEGRLEG